jgi:WD40 repeat protein/serine/threonine protein kinase
MATDSSERMVLLNRLADEFAERYRRGERPALQEYIDRHPALADDIRDLFPALAAVEQVKEDRRDVPEPVAGGPLPPLQRLGDYRIVREVGRGGMGVVYEAEQLSLGRRVALKVLPHKLPDARAKQRFEREARAAAKLHHTNIVPVFGFGEHDGLPFYAMQFIQGLGLDDVLVELKRMQSGGPVGDVPARDASAADVARSLLTGQFAPAAEATVDHAPQPRSETPTPPASRCSDSWTLSGSSAALPGQGRATYWQSVARIGVQVADALEHAHKQGVLHRDVKPSNLLLDAIGTVWVTDFGLAKADDQPNLTHTGDILGTLRYMPPEALDGNSDARSDVYAVGLTLYELLALRPAFAETDRNKLIKQVMQEAPVRLGRLNPQVPTDLETIVHKAIDRDPDRRYSTAGALAEDLQRFLADVPIQARRLSPTERVRRWCRHNPVVAGLITALALVFLAGFAGVAWKWQEAERQKDIAEVARQDEAEQREIAVRQAGRSRRLLYASDMSLALHAWEVGDTGRALDLLERQWPQAGQQDLLGFEWRYLWRLCQDGSRQTLRGHTGAVTALAFAPDGKTLATGGADRSVRVWDLASRRHLKLLGCSGKPVAFAPDGKTLALVEGQKSVCLWDMGARRERAILPFESGVQCLTFSPDGKLLATGHWDGIVRTWEVAARREAGTWKAHRGPVAQVVFAPDGKTLASSSNDSSIRLWDVAERRVLARLDKHTAPVWSLAFSPDGTTLASASYDSTVRLWDTATGQVVDTLRGQGTAALSSVAFSRDGKLLATGGGDGTVRLWDVVTKRVAALLRGHTASVTAVAFAPDGAGLVSGSQDGTVKVWDAAAAPDPNLLTRHKGNVESIALSPDGKTLAVPNVLEQTVTLWDLASRKAVAVLQGHTSPVCCVAFVPGGQHLASADVEGTVRLWDVATKRCLADCQTGISGWIKAAPISPDGKLLAVVDSSGTVPVWDLATRQRLWQLTPGREVVFSPDSTMLAASSGNAVRLWDVASREPVAALTGHVAEVLCLAFAPDGRTLAAGDSVGTLHLWDVVQKRQLASRRGHSSNICSVVFSPDGRRLATGGGDRTLKLWDVAPLQEVASLTDHDGPVNCVAFSHDGNTLVTTSADGTVRLWQAPPLPAAPRAPAGTPLVPPVETIRLFALEQHGTAKAKRSVEGNAQRVDVTAVDGTAWHAQLVLGFDDLQEGATYTIRFRAKADAARSITLAGIIGEHDFHRIGLDEVVSLTPNWKDYRYEFRAKDLAAGNMIQFHLGDRTGTVWVSDFSLTKGAK